MAEQKQNRKIHFSLRSKIIVTLSLAVIAVLSILLYFTSQMIYQDKKAYLYDNSFNSVETSSYTLNQYFLKKKEILSAYRARLPDDAENDAPAYFSSDKDLYQIGVFKLENSVPISNPETTSESTSTFTSPEAISEQDSTTETPETVAPQFRLIYTNSNFTRQYRKKEDFLGISQKTFDEEIKNAVRDGLVMKLHYEDKRAPRVLVYFHDASKNAVYRFDYLMDNFLENILRKYPFEIAFVNSAGKILFHNKPYIENDLHSIFYRSVIQKLSEDISAKVFAGVTETDIGRDKYIMSYKRLDDFKDFYIFSGIKKEQAYEVTILFIMNMGIYALVLVAFSNVISIYLARSITTPLDKMTIVMKDIANGKFNARVEEQQTSELDIVGQSFNKMVDKIQDYNLKLQEANRLLEQKVEARTIDLKKANVFIRTMLDSINQGILVVGRNGICSDLFTKACEVLIGQRPANKDLASLIKVDDRQSFKDWLDALFEEMIPFEALVDLGQKSIPSNSNYKADDFKHITLEFFPMRNDDEKIENVVLVASDKTREFIAGKEIESQQSYIKLVSKVIEDKVNFSRFIGHLQDEMNNYKNAERENKLDIEAFKRFLHTMKGTGSFYFLNQLVEDIHEFENDLNTSDIIKFNITQRIDQLLVNLHQALESIKKFIGADSKTSNENFDVKCREFMALLTLTDQDLAHTFAESFLKIPAENYINQYKSLVLDLSLQLGKKVNPLVIKNGHIKIDKQSYQSLFDSSIHIFRNALDHAIEKPEDRLLSGKKEFGTISVEFGINDELKQFIFKIQDDGRGIDPNRIREKMKKLNYPIEQISEDDKQIIYHIFDSSFSTAEEVTLISGRGVGLYDIKVSVEKLGGSIEVISKVGKGSIFNFTLPLE